jgi:hypothetical protein
MKTVPCSPLKVIDVSKELVAIIFSFEEKTKQETNTKQAANMRATFLPNAG